MNDDFVTILTQGRDGEDRWAMTPTDAVAQERSFAMYLASRLATIAFIALQVGGRVARTVSRGRFRKDKKTEQHDPQDLPGALRMSSAAAGQDM